MVQTVLGGGYFCDGLILGAAGERLNRSSYPSAGALFEVTLSCPSHAMTLNKNKLYLFAICTIHGFQSVVQGYL